MKLSLKFRDDTHQNPLLRAKVPVTILGLPFLSAVVAGEPSDLSFSLRTNFSSGPALSLSYHPSLPASAAGVNPFSVSLKSGIGIFGSPQNSPLVFNAHFNLRHSNATLVPAFSLLVKPQFGNFSLRKSTSSANASSNQADGSGLNRSLSDGSIPNSGLQNGLSLERPLQWKDLRNGEGYAEINGILSGILVTAKTSLPLTKCSVVNFRWGVDFPMEGSKMSKSRPVLMLNKIQLERMEEVKKKEEGVKKKNVKIAKSDELDLLKGVCALMRTEMEDLQRQNREIKQALEGTKMHLPNLRVRGDDKRGVSVPSVEKTTDFSRWRSRKNGGCGGSGCDEDDRNKAGNGSRMSEVESELQKALKANASS